MDMFKLLARSTNLPKSGSKQQGPTQQLPSAGILSSDPKDEHNVLRIEHAAEEISRGTKRKRRKLEDTNTNVPVELDFFSGQKKQTIAKKEAGEQNGNIGKQKDNEHISHDRPTPEATKLNAHERSLVLKKHKVKVRVLGDPNNTGAKVNWEKQQEPRGLGRKKEPHYQIWPQPLAMFADLRTKYRISNRLADNLDTQGYSKPTEVQLVALPILLGSDEDRGLVDTDSSPSTKPHETSVDLLTVAPTGSGKTLAYLIPILQGLIEARRGRTLNTKKRADEHLLRAVILAPTHELVDQIVNEARKLAIGTGIKVGGLKKGMRVHASFSGEEPNDKIHSSDEPLVKADLLVSTPLMMIHGITSAPDSTNNALPFVRYIVLDEADILLDPLFREQTLNVWSACSNPLLQSTLWSATIGSSIESLAQKFILTRRGEMQMKDRPTSSHKILRLIVGLKDSAIPTLTHHLTYTASEQGKLLALRQLLHPSPTQNERNAPALQAPFLIFTQTISRAVALHSELLYDIPPEAGGSNRLAVLHADLSSNARSAIMAGLRKGEVWIVITTDLLSRGVDIRGLNGVVNYDIPTTGASYVHRVGRTGRQGRNGGVAVTFYTKDDIPYVKNVANVIAASERARKKAEKDGDSNAATKNAVNMNGRQNGADKSSSVQGVGLQKWLLDALPRVSKKAKEELKRRGVESRRPSTVNNEQNSAVKRKARISTKSGYARRMEDRKKGAILGSQHRKRILEQNGAQVDEGGEEWGGFDG